jgi:hypothetical protein
MSPFASNFNLRRFSLGVQRNRKKEIKVYDVGDCEADVGNRKAGRHSYRDWDCAGFDGVPSACQSPGKAVQVETCGYKHGIRRHWRV